VGKSPICLRTRRACTMHALSFLYNANPSPAMAMYRAGVAQLVEQLTCNEKVEGSIPFTGTIQQYQQGHETRTSHGYAGFFIAPHAFKKRRYPCRINRAKSADQQWRNHHK